MDDSRKLKDKPFLPVKQLFQRLCIGITKQLSLDLRSLALFRIGLGTMVLVDLFLRSQDLLAHYTDQGIFPRADAIQSEPLFRYSFHFAVGDTFSVGLLFIVHALIAALFIVGWRTQWIAILLWLFSMSLHNRNYMVNQGGDVFLHLLLLYAALLPVGEYASFDSASRPLKDSGLSKKIFVFAGVGLIIQIFCVYFFSGLLKLQETTWQSGLGVYYALASDQLATRWGAKLAFTPWLTRALNHATVALEFAGPWFLLVSSRGQILRSVLVGSFITFHLASALLLEIGIFPLVGCVAWLALLPSEFWDSQRVQFFGQGLSDRWQNFVCRLPLNSYRVTPASEIRSAIKAVFVFMIIIVSVWWNLGGVKSKWDIKWQPLRSFAYAFGLDQKWNMFAVPIVADGWYVVPGRLSDGSWVSLRQFASDWQKRRWDLTEEPEWRKPAFLPDAVPRDRWRKFLMNMQANYWGDMMKLNYGRYLCRSWNASVPDEKKLEAFYIYFVREDRKPSMTRAEPAHFVMWRHECFSTGLLYWEEALQAFSKEADAPPEFGAERIPAEN